MLSSLSPARRRLVIAVCALVLVALVVAAVVVVREAAELSVDPVAQDQPGPVLVVPGYGGSTDSVTPPETSRLDGALNLTVQSVCSGSQVHTRGLPEEPAVAAILGPTLGAVAPTAPDGCPA